MDEEELYYSTNELKTEPYDADTDVQEELMNIERLTNSKILFYDPTEVEHLENTEVSTTELEIAQHSTSNSGIIIKEELLVEESQDEGDKSNKVAMPDIKQELDFEGLSDEQQSSKIDISEEELRTFWEDLMTMCKCTVCKQTLKAPVVTCQEGHFMCSQCQKEKCDVCSNSIVKDVQLSTVTKWLQQIPRECEFSNRGCKTIILPSSHHESYCPYSYTCEICGATDHIQKHCVSKHIIAVRPRSEVTDYWNLIDTNHKAYYMFNGSLFWLSVQRAKDFVITQVYCLRCKTSDVDFIYTMKYFNSEVVYAYTGNVLDYKVRDKYEEDNENFMKIPKSKLPLLSEDSRLKFSLRISKLVERAVSVES